MRVTITRSKPSDPAAPVELRVVGSVDLSTRDALLDAARSAILLSPTLRLDASGVEFIDSVGISALIQIIRWTEIKGGGLEFTGRSTALQHALDLVGLGTAWP